VSDPAGKSTLCGDLQWIVDQYVAGAELVVCPRYTAERAIARITELESWQAMVG
jgi:hypothetical protein